ncbi:MAG: heat-shock protein, partial [Verrucomicrobia bacterium]|nr:heat-shock protein [Verrucomicrobiota bacterium]
DLIWRLARLSTAPAAFERLEALEKDNQGFAIFQMIEGAKIDLTSRDEAPLRFVHPRIPIDERLTLAEFNHNSADLTAQIADYLDRFLGDAKISPQSVETVFLTGGTSLIRSLRGEFAQRFGLEKLRDGGEFTSVGDGLALSAPLFFPELHSNG